MKYTKQTRTFPLILPVIYPFLVSILAVLISTSLVLGMRQQKSSFSNRPPSNTPNAKYQDQFCKEQEKYLTEVDVNSDLNALNSAKKM